MWTGSEALYVYLQHPHSRQWVTVGRYRLEPGAGMGWFTYAPSWLDSEDPVSIDPVNLPLSQSAQEFAAPRYRGLHDVLRDACPDAWGQTLLRMHHALPQEVHPSRFLILAENSDRWGALAVGAGKVPPVSHLAHPRLTQLSAVVDELQAIAERRPALNTALRKRLVHRSSLGGARPKASLVDADKNCWLVKPILATDTADIPRLEHFAMRWAHQSGLNVAPTVFHAVQGVSVSSAVRVLRFDREASVRHMTLSAASLLQLEYPATPLAAPQRSYPHLAEALRRIGAPVEDSRELFGRMVFNALCGNDDDHARNHAVVYRADERRWRLAPAYDIVPNPDFVPDRLSLAVSSRETGLGRASLLWDCQRFGFSGLDEGNAFFDALLTRFEAEFHNAADILASPWRDEMQVRMTLRLAQWRQKTKM